MIAPRIGLPCKLYNGYNSFVLWFWRFAYRIRSQFRFWHVKTLHFSPFIPNNGLIIVGLLITVMFNWKFSHFRFLIANRFKLKFSFMLFHLVFDFLRKLFKHKSIKFVAFDKHTFPVNRTRFMCNKHILHCVHFVKMFNSKNKAKNCSFGRYTNWLSLTR